MLLAQSMPLIFENEASADYCFEQNDIIVWLENVSQHFGVQMPLSCLAPNMMRSSISSENLLPDMMGILTSAILLEFL